MNATFPEEKAFLEIINQQEVVVDRLKKIVAETRADSIDSPGRNEVRYDARKEELARLAEAHDGMLLDEERLLISLQSDKLKIFHHDGQIYILVDELGGKKFKTSFGVVTLVSINSPIGQQLSRGI